MLCDFGGEDMPDSGKCDWCKQDSKKLISRRDDEEGLYGPLYSICLVCDAKRDKKLKEESERYAERYGYE